MKKRLIALAVLFASVSYTATAQTVWYDLFNGKNLKGWKKLNGNAPYEVKDGVITGYSKSGEPNTFLCTEKNYSDFILELEFKVDDKLNSGIQFRSQSLSDYNKGRVHGYQCEIDPSDRAWSAGIYDEARRGWLYSLDKNPQAKTAFRKGEWNKVRIEAIGNRIVTLLNGVPCSNLVDDMTPEGFIALQVHGVPKNLDGLPVSWRNIRICTENLENECYKDFNSIPEVNTIPNTLTDREIKEGWKLLWDGKTVNGWRGAKIKEFPKNGWVIENGLLKVMPSDGGESTNGGDIITNDKYTDFELSVDFKITEGANSGIKYFVDPELNKGEGSAIGCEFQLLDDEKHPDAKLGVAGNRKLGSLYDLIAAPDNKPYKKGEFNNARVIVKGGKVEHWLNGVKIVEYKRGTQMWKALVAYSKYRDWPSFGEAVSGHILLQDHGNEVWFKNVKIKTL